jgi:imidazoleglycerol phosphate synthase glutamine amidotransferase subunit HisH
MNILLCYNLVVKGLGLIPGTVGRFDSRKGLIVPHIGWNALQPVKDFGILQGVEGHHVYFVHSYRALPVLSTLLFFFVTVCYTINLN